MGGTNRPGHFIKFFIYLIVVVLINIVGITLFFRIDLTENKVYSLSKASQQVVSTLSEPLTIKVFFTQNLPAPHNNTERYLRDLLEEYGVYASHYFNYHFYDVSPEEGDMDDQTKENQELAKNYGIYPVQIQVVEKDEVKFQKAYMGLVLIHGDIIERIRTITSTDGLEYKLTTAIQKLNNKISALLNLQKKIQVRLFLSSSLLDVAPHMRLSDLAELPKRLEAIVQDLNKKTYGKLEFAYLDPTKDPSAQAESKKYNILKLKWPDIPSRKIESGQGSIGLVMAYKDKVIEIPLIRILRLPLIGTQYEMTDMDKMEEILNESLESLIDINEDLGYLADHGTFEHTGAPMDIMGRQDQDSISNFRDLVSRTYAIKSISLKDGTIPEGLGCLIIARPKESFSDYELFMIDQFLMKGGNLAIFLDAFNEIANPNQRGMPPGYGQGRQYVPLNTGLEKLLEHYGVRIRKSYVLDENCYKQRVPTRMGGGERPIYFAPIIKNRFINDDLAFIENIKGLIAIKASPLELDMESLKENDLKAYTLFSSSEQSWEMRERINLNPIFMRPPQPDDERRSLPLACVLEGEFPSYFTGKPVPQKEVPEDEPKNEDEQEQAEKKKGLDLSKISGEGEVLTKSKPAKIFLMASTEMLTDNLIDDEGRSPNAMFIMNAIDFLNNREDIAVMRSKEQRFNPLYDTVSGTKTFVKSFNIIGLPVLVVLFGLLVWVARHSRKKQIQMMFQQ